MLQLTWMTPHKLPSDLQKVEVDFVEILARVEDSDPQSHERDGDRVELITAATRGGTFQPLRISWSSAANLFFAAIAFLGALTAVYFLNNAEYSRRLHTGWPNEFLYPRPGVEKQSSEMIAQTAPGVGSTSALQARQKPDVAAIFRDLTSANPISDLLPASLASSSFFSQPANQAPETLSNAGGSVADQSTNVGQRAMSEMHSATSERTRSDKSRQESSAAMSRKTSTARRSLFDWSASNARIGHSTMVTSVRSMKSSLAAMQAHGANANHIQTRLTMTGGLIDRTEVTIVLC